MSSPALLTSDFEARQDIALGVCFFIVSLVALARVVRYVRKRGGGNNTILLFHVLILFASFSRTLWFIIPIEGSNSGYVPQPSVMAFKSANWLRIFVSQLLLSLGSFAFYSVFVLLACYWASMIRLTELNAIEPHYRNNGYGYGYTGMTGGLPNSLNASGGIEARGGEGGGGGGSIWSYFSLSFLVQQQRTSTFSLFTHFLTTMQCFAMCEALNIALFLLQFFNLEQVIVFDSILFCIVSLVSLVVITVLSSRFRLLLASHASSDGATRSQLSRILTITIAANIYFLLRAALEGTTAYVILRSMQQQHTFTTTPPFLPSYFWDSYILIKHSSEALIMAAELYASSAVPKPPAHQQQQPSSTSFSVNMSRRSTEVSPLIATRRDTGNDLQSLAAQHAIGEGKPRK